MRWGLQVLSHELLLSFYGRLDSSLGAVWEAVAARSVVLDRRKVIIDFSEVEAMDSLAVCLCGYGVHHFQALAIPLALVQPPPALLPLLQMAGLAQIPAVVSHAREA